MKSALLLEQDQASIDRTANMLRWLGYIVVPVRSPRLALHAIEAIKFNLILTCTTTVPDDRRSLTGELKRLVPSAAIVLIADEEQRKQGWLGNCAEINAVVSRPLSLEHPR